MSNDFTCNSTMHLRIEKKTFENSQSKNHWLDGKLSMDEVKYIANLIKECTNKIINK